MKTIKASRVRKTLALGAAMGLGLGVLSAPPAAAAPGSTTLDYTCDYPLIGKRDLSVEISTSVPEKIGTGQSIGKIQVNWTATLGADTTEGLQAIDAASLEGHATAQAKLVVPEKPGGTNVTVRNALQKTSVPSSGGFQITGYGEAPALAFSQTGKGVATLGDMSFKITGEKADGSSTALGTFDVTCTQKPGQDTTVAEFDIVDGPTEVPEPLPVPGYWPGQARDEPKGTLKYDLNLNGSSFIKAPNGTAPINGSIGVNVDGGTGAITGDLVLNKTKGDFAVLGFLPVTADIAFEQVGQTVGTYANGQIKTTSTMYVKLPGFYLMGIPIGGGDECKTKEPSKIQMQSEDGKFFNPKVGGKFFAKDYALSEIENCNVLTGILSIFTAGSGNTIDLTLSPN